MLERSRSRSGASRREARPAGLAASRARRGVAEADFPLPRSRRWPLGLLLLLAALASSAPAEAVLDGAAGDAAIWRWLGAVGARGEGPTALAEGRAGDLAVGDAGGVSWWRGSSSMRAVLPVVRDLAFDSQGLLWIATEDGLYVWPREGRPTRRSLRGGDASNRIRRIEIDGQAMLLATDGGGYWSSDGRIFQLLRVAGAATPVERLALRRRGLAGGASAVGEGIVEVWLLAAGHLARVRGRPTSSGLRVIDSRRLPLPPSAIGDRRPVDLLLGPEAGRLLLVFEDALVWAQLAPGSGDILAGGWQTSRPSLPPGSVLRRASWTAGRVLLASDHGLLSGPSLVGPFSRVASSAGTSDCIDVSTSRVYAALALCRSGLFALGPLEATSAVAIAGARPAAPSPSDRPLRPDPPVAEIRRRALLRSGLDVSEDRRLRRGLWQRAYWPEVLVRFAADVDRDRSRDSDQSFLSGDTRHLLDRRRDEGHRFEASVVLDWELGGLAFPDDAVDLSRELRQVVSLRDDVADEINQLYFERQSIRERLSTPGAVESADEAERLRWRAREIDAGLDAWTGGWISRWRVERATGVPAARSDFEGSRYPEPRIERNEE